MNAQQAIQNAILADFSILDASNNRLGKLSEEINENTMKIVLLDKGGQEVGDDIIKGHSKLVREYYLLIGNNEKLAGSIAVAYKLSKIISDVKLELPEQVAAAVQMISDSNVNLITFNKGKVEIIDNDITKMMDERAEADFNKEEFLSHIRASELYNK